MKLKKGFCNVNYKYLRYIKHVISILHICTGKYIQFWDTFYTSANLNLFPTLQKHFFVFTDFHGILPSDHITVIHKIPKGFPDDSLYRYHYFLEIKEQLSNYDFVFFFNANTKFLEPIGDEFLPERNENEGLVIVKHAGYTNRSLLFYPYERSKTSSAYVHFTKNATYGYYWGGINGGLTSSYITMCKKLSKWIDLDRQKGLVARFHDESYFNKYMQQGSPKVMDSSYGFPEGWKTNAKIKILILDKVLVNPNFKKQHTEILPRIIGFSKILISGIIWRFGK